MRTIERWMVLAVKAFRDDPYPITLRRANMKVKCGRAGQIKVMLHNNVIYQEVNGLAHFSWAGWYTPTTFNRLLALGANPRIKALGGQFDGVYKEDAYYDTTCPNYEALPHQVAWLPIGKEDFDTAWDRALKRGTE